MNPKNLVTLSILSALLLSGCGSKSISNKTIEKALESQTGAKVDIDSGKDKVTIKTEDGQTQYSQGGNAEIPEGLPRELIVAADAKIFTTGSSNGGITVTYTTDLDPSEILEKVKKDLVGNVWKKDMEIAAGENTIISISQGKKKVSMTIGKNNSQAQTGKTLVYLLVVDQL